MAHRQYHLMQQLNPQALQEWFSEFRDRGSTITLERNKPDFSVSMNECGAFKYATDTRKHRDG